MFSLIEKHKYNKKVSTVLYGDFNEVLEVYHTAKKEYQNSEIEFEIWYENSNLHDFKVMSLYNYDVIILRDINDCFYALDIRQKNGLGVLFKNKSFYKITNYLHNNNYDFVEAF